MVRIAYPPPIGAAPDPLHATLASDRTLKRIFDPTRYGATALGFRAEGPLSRFDHQRPEREGSPLAPDAGRGTWYAGRTLSAALAEFFGSANPSRIVDLGGPYQVALVRLRHSLRLLDLRKEGAMRAGTVHAVCATPDRALAQAWARYFYDQAVVYGDIDGILYPSAHNEEACVALFERAAPALVSPPSGTLPLRHRGLRPALEVAAQRNHLVLIGG